MHIALSKSYWALYNLNRLTMHNRKLSFFLNIQFNCEMTKVNLVNSSVFYRHIYYIIYMKNKQFYMIIINIKHVPDTS